MHTRASNSELVEPLPEPKRTLNQRLRQRNRRVPYDQRNNLPQHPRIVYLPILDINHFRHFLDILQNYDPMDDEPIDTENEVVRLMMFPLSLTREAKTWLNELNEGTIKMWDELRTAFIIRFFPLTFFDRILGEIRAFSQHENESLTDAWLRMKEMLQNAMVITFLKKTVAFANEDSSNTDTDKIMAQIDVMTMKIDAQYKELQSRAKQPTTNLDDDDIPMSREEEAKFMQTFYLEKSSTNHRETSTPPAPKTAKQLATRRNHERVKSILLLAIPDEYLHKYHNWVYEDELKRSSGSNSASQNLAFLSSEEILAKLLKNTAGGINQVPSTPCAHDVAYSFFTQPTTSSSDVKNEDFQQIDGDDLEELDL
ncbi:reverse transcriptase domain-containing protein [Tanacetum coccineum]